MEVSVIERINVVLKHFCKTPNGLANMLEMIPMYHCKSSDYILYRQLL